MRSIHFIEPLTTESGGHRIGAANATAIGTLFRPDVVHELHEHSIHARVMHNQMIYHITFERTPTFSLSLEYHVTTAFPFNNCLGKIIMKLALDNDINILDFWRKISRYFTVYESNFSGHIVQYVTIRDRDIVEVFEAEKWLSPIRFSLNAYTAHACTQGITLREFVETSFARPIGADKPKKTKIKKSDPNYKVRPKISKGDLITAVQGELGRLGFTKGDNVQQQLDYAGTHKELPKLRSLMSQKYNHYSSSSVKRQLDSAALDKVIKSMQDYYLETYKGKLSRAICELLVIEDDWSLGSLWDSAKSLGSKAVDFLGSNYDNIIDAGTQALSGNYLGAAKRIGSMLLNTPVEESKESRPPTATNGNFGPAFSFQSPSGAHKVDRVSHTDISLDYLMTQLDHQQPGSGPPNLPPLQCSTNSLLVQKFTINIPASNNAFVSIAPWNLFSSTTASALGDNRAGFCSYAVYSAASEGLPPGTPIPNANFTDVLSTQASNSQLGTVHVNSVHVEFIPVFSMANNSFVATVSCFDMFVPSDNSLPIASNVWYKTSTMLLQHGARQVSSNAINGLYGNYFAESIDQPKGDGWNLMIDNAANTGAAVGYSDSPRIACKIEGPSVAMTLNVIVTASFSAFPTVAGLNNIKVETPKLGPRSADFFDLLFGTYPDLKYASPKALTRLASALRTSGTRNCDKLFSMAINLLGSEYTHDARSMKSTLPYEQPEGDFMAL